MDRGKYQQASLKWLVEMELVNDPQLINQVKMNVLMTSKRIKEVELLIYREQKSMLVLLELSWLGRTFFKKSIFADVEDILSQLLPSFRFRVTSEPRIMQMAVDRVKIALGGRNENVKNSSVSSRVLDNDGSKSSETESVSEAVQGSIGDSVSDSQEQSKAFTSVQLQSVEDDRDSKQKTPSSS